MAFYSDAESGRTRLINSGPGAISTIVWIDVPNVKKKKDGEHIVLYKKEQENVILVEVLTSSGTRNYGAGGFVERKGWKWGGEERQGWKMMELLSFNAHMNTRTHRKRAHDTVKNKR